MLRSAPVSFSLKVFQPGRQKAAVFFVCAVAAFFLALPPCWATAEKIVIGGSGTNLPSVRLLAREFMKSHPDIKIEIPSSLGSTGGIRAVAEGAVTIGLTSRPLRNGESHFGLSLIPYARTALILGVNPDVPDRGITSKQLVKIFEGKRKQWLNGRDIVVLSREPGDSGIEILKARVPGFAEVYDECQAEKRWTTLYTDGEMNLTLEKTHSAIGITDSASIITDRLRIRILTFDGVYPSPENVRQGKYPLVKTLSFVFRENTLTPHAKAFIAFARSHRGLKTLTGNGYLPPQR